MGQNILYSSSSRCIDSCSHFNFRWPHSHLRLVPALDDLFSLSILSSSLLLSSLSVSSSFLFSTPYFHSRSWSRLRSRWTCSCTCSHTLRLFQPTSRSLSHVRIRPKLHVEARGLTTLARSTTSLMSASHAPSWRDTEVHLNEH